MTSHPAILRRRRKGSTLPPASRERSGRLTVEAMRIRSEYLEAVGGFWPERSFRPVYERPGRGDTHRERHRPGAKIRFTDPDLRSNSDK